MNWRRLRFDFDIAVALAMNSPFHRSQAKSQTKI
jgi:hypothetical protein